MPAFSFTAPYEGISIDEVLTVGQFKEMTMEEREQYMREVRKYVPDLEIRKHWEMNFNAYNNHLSRLGLVTAKKFSEDRPLNKDGTQPLDETPSRQGNGKGPWAKNKENSRQGKSGYIDAEFSVVREDKKPSPKGETALAVQNSSQDTDIERRTAALQSGTYLSFDVEGTPEAIQKRLTAVGNLLALEEGNLKLKIEVYKA